MEDIPVVFNKPAYWWRLYSSTERTLYADQHLPFTLDGKIVPLKCRRIKGEGEYDLTTVCSETFLFSVTDHFTFMAEISGYRDDTTEKPEWRMEFTKFDIFLDTARTTEEIENCLFAIYLQL